MHVLFLIKQKQSIKMSTFIFSSLILIFCCDRNRKQQDSTSYSTCTVWPRVKANQWKHQEMFLNCFFSSVYSGNFRMIVNTWVVVLWNRKIIWWRILNQPRLKVVCMGYISPRSQVSIIIVYTYIYIYISCTRYTLLL